MALLAVSDASPLIALEQVKHLELIAPLFETLTVPSAVVHEISPTIPILPPWIRERSVSSVPTPSRGVRSSLGPGETEAIALALELGGHVVILDDRSARTHAKGQGLTVMGTVAILLLAKRAALVTEIRPSLEALLNVQFFISPQLVREVLTQEGELG